MQRIKILVSFFLATIAGTMLHECGHYITGLMVGFRPALHYMSTSCLNCLDINHKAGTWEELLNYERRDFIFRIGGPLQTIVTGTIGLMGLIVISRKRQVDAYNSKHLFWIIVAYFWSREFINSLFFLLAYSFFHTVYTRGDEYQLFKTLDTNAQYGHLLLAAFSGLILGYVTFRLVGLHRKELIIYGVLGCIVGYPSWMYWLGPLLLP